MIKVATVLRLNCFVPTLRVGMHIKTYDTENVYPTYQWTLKFMLLHILYEFPRATWEPKNMQNLVRKELLLFLFSKEGKVCP